MNKFALALALSAANASRVPASAVCVTNYLNETITWQFNDAFFIQDSANFDQNTATTSCQNLTTAINPAPVQGDGYEVWSFYSADTFFESNFGYPFFYYDAAGPQINYFCGEGAFGYCCCEKGSIQDVCIWDLLGSYPSCVAPSHITQPHN